MASGALGIRFRLILDLKPIKDKNGVEIGTDYTYAIPEMDKGGIRYDDNRQVVYLKHSGKPDTKEFATKSVYDPAKMSDASYNEAAKRVSQKVYDDKVAAYLANPIDANRVIREVDVNTGLTFTVYFQINAGINNGLPFIGNAHIIAP